MVENNNAMVQFGGGRGMEMVTADPAAIAAAESAKQRIQAAYMVAIHRPRNVDQARVKILEACKRPAFAEQVEYSKPVGDRKITGPSIRFAETALREWGNIISETQVVYEDASLRRVRIIITDLETNSSFTKEIQVSKTVERRNPPKDREVIGKRTNTGGQMVYIVAATDDELLIKEAAMASKAIRNEGLRLIPSDIIEEAIAMAQQTLANRDSQDPDAAKKKMIDAFVSMGVLPVELEKYLKHPLSQSTTAEIADLRKVYESLRTGEAKWSDYVGAAAPAEEKKGSSLEQAMKKSEVKHEPKGEPVAVEGTVESPAPEKPKKAAAPAPAKSNINNDDEGVSLAEMLKSSPVTLADLESYLKAEGKLGHTMTLAKNPTLEKMVKANINTVVNKVLTWKETNNDFSGGNQQ